MAIIEVMGQVDGQTVHAATLTGNNGLRVKVITYGARLAELWVPDRAGQLADIVLGHDTLAEYEASGTYLGATCGRYANRIARGRFVLDGELVTLYTNEGQQTLHGGASGFDRKNWLISSHSDRSITFTVGATDGEMGFPGNLQAQCTYWLDDQDQLWIEMSAQTDAPTVVNLVNHAYFNLAGQGSGPVLGQHLRVDAAHYTPVGATLIPTGEILAVTGTPFDFTALRAIGAVMNGPKGFDHNWCLSEPLHPFGEALMRPCAEAFDTASGRRLRLWTNEPGVQVYIGGYFDDSLAGKRGAAYGPFAGFALETQRFPDSPNRPQFPSARLDPGQTYRHLMAFNFDPAPQ